MVEAAAPRADKRPRGTCLVADIDVSRLIEREPAWPVQRYGMLMPLSVDGQELRDALNLRRRTGAGAENQSGEQRGESEAPERGGSHPSPSREVPCPFTSGRRPQSAGEIEARRPNPERWRVAGDRHARRCLEPLTCVPLEMKRVGKQADRVPMGPGALTMLEGPYPSKAQ